MSQAKEFTEWVGSVAKPENYPAIQVSGAMKAVIKDVCEMANITIKSRDLSVFTQAHMARLWLQLCRLTPGLKVMDVDKTVAAHDAATRARQSVPEEAVWSTELVPRLKANVMSAGTHLQSAQRQASKTHVWISWHGCTELSILNIADNAQRLMAAHRQIVTDFWAHVKANAETSKKGPLTLEEETALYYGPAMDLPRALEVESISRVAKQDNEWLLQVCFAYPETVGYLQEAGSLELTHPTLGTISWCCMPRAPKSELIVFDLQTSLMYLADLDAQNSFLQQVLEATEASYASNFAALPDVRAGAAAAARAEATAAAEADAASMTPGSKAAKIAAAGAAANDCRAAPDIDYALYDEDGVPLVAINKELMHRKTQVAVRFRDIRTAALILIAAPLGKLPSRVVSASLHNSSRIKGLKLNVIRVQAANNQALLHQLEQVATVLAATVAMLDNPDGSIITAADYAVDLSTSTHKASFKSHLQRLQRPMPKVAAPPPVLSYEESLAQLLQEDEGELLAGAAVEAAAAAAGRQSTAPLSAAAATTVQTAALREPSKQPLAALHTQSSAGTSRGKKKTSQQQPTDVQRGKTTTGTAGKGGASKNKGGHVATAEEAEKEGSLGVKQHPVAAADKASEQHRVAGDAAAADQAQMSGNDKAEPYMQQQRDKRHKENASNPKELRGKNPDGMIMTDEDTA